jgi:hypothetical protein
LSDECQHMCCARRIPSFTGWICPSAQEKRLESRSCTRRFFRSTLTTVLLPNQHRLPMVFPPLYLYLPLIPAVCPVSLARLNTTFVTVEGRFPSNLASRSNCRSDSTGPYIAVICASPTQNPRPSIRLHQPRTDAAKLRTSKISGLSTIPGFCPIEESCTLPVNPRSQLRDENGQPAHGGDVW